MTLPRMKDIKEDSYRNGRLGDYKRLTVEDRDAGVVRSIRVLGNCGANF